MLVRDNETMASSQFMHSNHTISESVQDVINLLKTWNLPQLCNKFQEEEVCTTALKLLTEQDICELVPKIGPRSVFRAALHKWKQQMELDESAELNTQLQRETTYNATSEDSKEPLVPLPHVVKVETEFYRPLEASQPQIETVFTYRENTSPIQNLTQDENPLLDSIDKVSNDELNIDYADEEVDTTAQKPSVQILHVNDILLNSFDGRKALKYYEVNKYLDANHRRRSVKAVISAIIEQRRTMTADRFHELAEQFVHLFPSERLDTYYVRRVGNICPRGALYNKYLNMCRHLRRDGLLDYRSVRRKRYCKTK